MANQKVYKIHIDGLEKSISEIDILMSQIDELEKKLNKISKSKVNVDVSAAKEIAENTKLQTDEYKKQIVEKEKLKKVNDEIKKQQKDIANGVRDTNGEFTNTLAGQRAYLAEIKKQLSTTDLNSDEWVVLRDRVAEVNESVKQLEYSYGQFTRNVGNYQDAAQGFANIKTEVEDANDALEALRNNAKIKVDVGGATIEFETLSQAIGEIDDMAQKASAQMQMLAEAGQENSDAYREAAATFSEYVQKAGELEKARKYADGIKDAFASQTRALDTTVQSFQAVVGSMQVASGVAGIFGADQEKLNEAMNRTVQLMGVAQGVQELYNKVAGEGGLLAQLNAKRTQAQTTATVAQTTATKGATVATKALGKAFKALGIGLIVSAVASLVSNWKDIVKWFDKSGKAAQTLGTAFDKLKQVFVGVGNVIVTYVKGPVEALINVFKGDFAGAMDSITSMFQLKKNYIEGETREVERQAEKQEKIKKEQLDKELEYKIQTMEATKDADYKYTVEGKRLYDKYYQNKLSLYKKDSDEYKQALLEKLKYQKDYEVYIEKQVIETNKKNQEAEEKRLKKQNELNQKFIEQTKEAFELVKETNEFISRQSLQAFKESSLNYQKAIAFYEMLSKFNPNELGTPLTLYAESIENLENQLDDNLGKINNIYDTVSDKIKLAQKFMQDAELLNFSNERKNNEASIASNLVNQLMEVEKVLNNSPEINNIKADLESLFYITAKEGYNADNQMIASLKKQLYNYNEYLESFNDEKIKTLTKKQREELIVNQQQYNDLLQIFKTYLNEMQYLQKDYQDKVDQFNIEQIDRDRQFISDKFAYLAEAYGYEYNDLLEIVQNYQNEINEASTGNQNADLVNSLISRHLNTKKLENSFGMLKEMMLSSLNEIDNEIKNFTDQKTAADNKINSYMEMLGLDPEKWEERITADPVLQQLIDEKNAIENQIVQLQTHSNAIEGILRSTNATLENEKLHLEDYVEIFGAVTSEAMGIANGIANMLANNAQIELENEQEKLDKELELLDKQLQAKEELYQKHNDKINSLEDELENARGSRRQHLIEQIAAEMESRENAYNEQVRIANEQERIEKEKQRLEEQARQAEIRRLKTQKVSDIAEATINTAVAVTKALKTSRIYAAIIGALGAAQVATIAATRYYADGGVLQGNSHAAGGIKVLGGSAEVEGNEFITNKRTTAQNVDLLYFINSKKKKLNLDDFVEFYSGNKRFNNVSFKNKFANGGQLPRNINNRNVTYIQDDRQIVVSVVEIENVSNKVKQARALAGL